LRVSVGSGLSAGATDAVAACGAGVGTWARAGIRADVSKNATAREKRTGSLFGVMASSVGEFPRIIAAAVRGVNACGL
jgi:hypothetical protein